MPKTPTPDEIDDLWGHIQNERDRLFTLRTKAEGYGKERTAEQIGKAIAFLLNAMQNLDEG